jgi:hypothetical protein
MAVLAEDWPPSLAPGAATQRPPTASTRSRPSLTDGPRDRSDSVAIQTVHTTTARTRMAR